MIDEGYVKFNCIWHPGSPPDGIDDLIAARNTLHSMGLVGEYADIGIGYGNVSKRIGNSAHFVVSGTATGKTAEATALHFCEVTAWDIAANSVTCIGPVAASSESMTHAMLYACEPAIQAILHVHHRGLWDYLLKTAPTSKEGIAYGTPAMAMEMERLLRETPLADQRILAMCGHEEGIIAFGSSVEEAMIKLEGKYTKYLGRCG